MKSNTVHLMLRVVDFSHFSLVTEKSQSSESSSFVSHEKFHVRLAFSRAEEMHLLLLFYSFDQLLASLKQKLLESIRQEFKCQL